MSVPTRAEPAATVITGTSRFRTRVVRDHSVPVIMAGAPQRTPSIDRRTHGARATRMPASTRATIPRVEK